MMAAHNFRKHGVTLLCGDNCELATKLRPASIDLVVTSPPYDDIRTYGGHSWDFYLLASLMKRALKPGGVIVWIVADQTIDGSETGSSMKQALHFKEIGLRLHDTMIYKKASFSFPDKVRYPQVWEYAFVLSNGKPKTVNLITDRKTSTAGKPLGGTYVRDESGKSVRQADPRDRARSKRRELGLRFNVWEYKTGSGQSSSDPIAFEHPAIFPESLARDHILSWSNPGDTVLDPFSGSGTTLAMAVETGRQAIGFESNRTYYDNTIKRINKLDPADRRGTELHSAG